MEQNAENTVREMIANYLKKFESVQAKAGPLGGLFGFGNNPKNDSCHTDFFESLDSYIASLTDISPEDAKAVVMTVMEAALDKTQCDCCHWTFVAAEKCVIRLTDRLSAEDKEQLFLWYGKQVPRRMRMPIEKELMQALGK